MKALIVGWFSFEQGHATAGDLLSRDMACDWLGRAGLRYDVALAPPFEGGVDWRCADPAEYSHVVFVCGPFEQGELESEFLTRFAGCRLIGLNLTMLTPLNAWNPFDFLIERDSSVDVHPDLVFAAAQPKVPVVGVCLVEPYPGAIDHLAVDAINRLLEARELSRVDIDTRLDRNGTGLRSPAEIESLIARMDVLVTTRLHGTVLALKNSVPVLAIDPEAGGAKIKRQADKIRWPVIFVADSLDDHQLQAALDYCLTEEARQKAKDCAERAKRIVAEMEQEFIAVLSGSSGMERRFAERTSALVSVVIPCYNQASFLREAIESVLAQTYRNFEIIVVDDGSIDDTAEVAAHYPEVRCVRQHNQGLAAARNSGILESSGPYLAFLDADDRLTPTALQSGVNCLHAHPECAFVSGHYRYINKDGSLLNEYRPEAVTKDRYLALLQGNYIGMHATVLYRRSALESTGGFDRSLRACEDYDLYLRIARQFPVHRHHEMVAEYRWHDSNMTWDSERMLSSALAALGKQWEYVREKPEYLEAYKRGIQFWRNYFGRSLWKRLAADVKHRRWRAVSKNLRLTADFVSPFLAALLMQRGITPYRATAKPSAVKPSRPLIEDSHSHKPRSATDP